MARPTMRVMRDNIEATAIGKTGLANDQHYKRRILEREFKATGNQDIASVLIQQQQATDRADAAKRYNTKPRQTRQSDGRRKRKDFKSPEGFNECGSVQGRSYASRAGERMERMQQGFPDVMRHPATINNMILPLTADPKASLDSCRTHMRDALRPLTNGAQVSGRFHFAMESAEYLATIFPENQWPEGFDPINRPDEVFGLLHWHGIIADPYLSKQDVRRIVREAFPGCRRVCVATVQPERINKHGEVTHGAQGYLEYAAMEKTEVKFDKTKQKKDAVIGHALLGGQVNKRNLSFSMGKSLDVTGVSIDPARVIELQVQERLAYVKRNFDKLSYAERFIHLWMSGWALSINKDQSWLQPGLSTLDSFLMFHATVKKWCTDPGADDTCFYDYLDALLE